MKYLVNPLLIAFLFSGVMALAQANDTRLVGDQVKEANAQKAELVCVPVKITQTMEIVAVSGKNEGFWIQKESVTIYKFTDVSKAVGTKLKPGTYYVYPYLKPEKLKAHVEVVLKKI